MPIIPEMRDYLDELTRIRRDIHAHPEIGFEEERTAELVAQNSPNGASRCIAGWRRPASSARSGAATRCARSACAPTWTACRCRS